MASVRFEHVTKRFDGLAVVKDLTLDIEDREFLVLVGPTGCGKSTTLRMLAGLEEVSEGEVHIGERRVTNDPPCHLDIAMVFQSYALYPHMTAYGNLAFSLKNRGRLVTRSSGGCGPRRRFSTSSSSWTGGPESSRAASASEWRSAVPSCASHRSS